MEHTQVVEKNIEYLPVIYLTQSMQELYQRGKKISDNQYPSILIAGESGTGKELLAKSIHYNLSAGAPFVTINCLNLPFDHFEEKIDHCFSIFNKPTALRGRSVKNKSTLFFRNIGKLEAHVQEDLLKYIQDRMIAAPLNAKKKPGNIRLIFSCSRNGSKTQAGDVFDKGTLKVLNPFLISILPLRDRAEDIQPLASFFIDKFTKEYGKDIGGIHSEALSLMESYPWPHNVSELRDVIENAVILSQSPLITKEDIRFNISKKSIALESFLSREDFFKLDELERIYIQTVLRRVKNNKSKASKILGISRNTLQRKLDSFSEKNKKSRPKKKKANQQPLLF